MTVDRTNAPLLGTVLLLSAACGAQPESAGTPPADQLVMELLATAIQEADTAVIVDLFRPEATYDDFAGQHTYEGVQEIVGYLTGSHQWGDDISMRLGQVHTGPGVIVGEWLFSAVQSRPIGDRVPVGTGREVVLNGVTILELAGQRIIRAADYTDNAPLALQLGGRIEFPGGGVLELDGPWN